MMDLKSGLYSEKYSYSKEFDDKIYSYSKEILIYRMSFQDNYQLLDFDCVILPGGGKFSKDFPSGSLEVTNPKRYFFEKGFIDYCYINKIPILGICRGYQMINESLGGKIDYIQEDIIKNNHINNKEHEVILDKNSFLFEIFKINNLKVNSLHSKKIIQISPKLKISAISKEDNIIEAFESLFEPKFFGLQWHPELLKEHQKIFNYFFDYVLNLNKK